MRRNNLSIKIVGAWRNFCSQAHKNATARYFLPFELSGNITIMYLENNLASKIQQSQHYTSERDVGGAVPYKRDRIVFLFCPTMVVIVDLFLRRANAVRPYRLVAVILSDIYIQFSSCVRGVSPSIMPLVAYTQNTAMHTHALTQVLYSLFQKLTSVSLSRRACTCPQVSKRFLLIPKITTFVA